MFKTDKADFNQKKKNKFKYHTYTMGRSQKCTRGQNCTSTQKCTKIKLHGDKTARGHKTARR